MVVRKYQETTDILKEQARIKNEVKAILKVNFENRDEDIDKIGVSYSLTDGYIISNIPEDMLKESERLFPKYKVV